MILAADIGGSHIDLGLVRGKRVFSPFHIPLAPGSTQKQVLAAIVAGMQRFRGYHKIAAAAPGPFRAAGVVGNTPNLPLRNFPLARFLRRRFRKQVVVENDAKCFALGEAVYGAGKRHRIVLGITLGTGIGGGLVIRKRLYRGRGNAGEIGHMLISRSRDLESLYQGLKRRDGSIRDFRVLGRYLGAAVVNAAHLYDPDVIIFGGRVSRLHFRRFLPEMRSFAARHLLVSPPLLLPSRLRHAALVGAGLL
ncbi:MAG TPA: ROK family protein [Candidatus Nanoarchaeia archaeon]|nr:ROK family protein [Candidatus Nanoarchaeia archaeon]